MFSDIKGLSAFLVAFQLAHMVHLSSVAQIKALDQTVPEVAEVILLYSCH